MSSEKTLFIRKWERAEGNAPSALLIHGLASSSGTWKQLAKDLYNQGYTVLAPDLLGHGRSPRSTEYSLETWSEAILSLNLGQPDIIVGHSMGGLIAAQLQETLQAKTLILIDPVFHLPKTKVLLRSVQSGFASVMIYKGITTLPSIKKITKAKDNQSQRELFHIYRWDRKAVNGLKPNPKIIAKRLLSGQEEILLIRAKRSFILPAKVMNRVFPENVKVSYFNNGHNIHLENYEQFWLELAPFLKERINNGGNILSPAPTL
jgi:pimeloyl-ACP methyl ester carboxylesterase